MKKFWIVLGFPEHNFSQVVIDSANSISVSVSNSQSNYMATLYQHKTYSKAKQEAEHLAKIYNKPFVILEAMEYCRRNDVIWSDCEEKE